METYCKHDDSRLNYAFAIKCKKKMENDMVAAI